MAAAWILLYHETRPEADNIWVVPPNEIAAAVHKAVDGGLDVTTLDHALSSERDCASITFDDGHRSVYDNAFPILAAIGITATVFVPVDRIDTPLAAHDTMTWSHLTELARHGWAIESHGCAHVPLSTLSDTGVDEELRRSKLVLEDRIGRAVTVFGYPYGVVPGGAVHIEQRLEAAGYRYAVLAAGGAARTPPRRPYRVPRDPVAPGQRISFGAAPGHGAATWPEC